MTEIPGLDPTSTPSGAGCVECLASHGWWLHLRRCAQCGHIGCCDTSPYQHATSHAQASGHLLLRSFEPGESWYWNYATEQFQDGPALAGPQREPHGPRLHESEDHPMTDAYVLGGIRTPVGRYGGALAHVRVDDLVGETMVAACQRVGVELDRIEDITVGCVNPAHEGMGDIARWGALAAGFPDSVPAITVNRFCASSLSGAISLAHAIRSDELGIGVAAGVESMSRSGWALMKGDAPFMPRGPVFMLDTMWSGAGGPPNPKLTARNAYIDMMQTAQNVANRYQLSRQEIDAFALRSHQHAAAARDSGRLAAEIKPIEIAATRKAPAWTFEHDESIRGDTTSEQLAALPAQPNTTQITAGNSSPLNDGASAVVLADAATAKQIGAEPLARIVSSATHALDPLIMGIAPAFAIPKALARAGLAPADIDVWEIHEAYSAQALGVLRELRVQLNDFDVPDDRLNPNGGAVAIGHPFGSSGTRYVLTLATELQLRGARYGVLAVCVGSGQGVALVLENPNAKRGN